MRRLSIALLLLSACASRPQSQVAFDHLLLFVSPNAPERAALERAGFLTAPDVNRHEGQGTASITYEFDNAFLELIWPDETVAVAPALTVAHQKFQKRSQWRTSGYAPIGIALHRVGPETPLPVASWSTAPPWMAPGTSMQILTARDDTASPSISVHPEGPKKGAAHSIGVRRVTAVRLIEPNGYTPVDAVTYLVKSGVITTARGAEWAVDLTFDGGAQRQSHDFRPDLPLVIHY